MMVRPRHPIYKQLCRELDRGSEIKVIRHGYPHALPEHLRGGPSLIHYDRWEAEYERLRNAGALPCSAFVLATRLILYFRRTASLGR